MPEIIELKKLQDFTNLRAYADSQALKIKHNDKKIYLENEPKGNVGKTLYAIAEKIRYEKIGSDKLKGIKYNCRILSKMFWGWFARVLDKY